MATLHDLAGSVEDFLTAPDETRGSAAAEQLRLAAERLCQNPTSPKAQGEVLFYLLAVAVRTGNPGVNLLNEASIVLTGFAGQAKQEARKADAAASPLAMSVSDLSTPKQIIMIRAICRDLDIDLDAELAKVFEMECKVEEISRKAASTFIDHLKPMQEAAGITPSHHAGPLRQEMPQGTTALAKNISELATPKQIVMIKAICRDLDIDVEIELNETLKMDCKVEELSRRAASAFIDHLKQLQEGDDIPVVRRAS